MRQTAIAPTPLTTPPCRDPSCDIRIVNKEISRKHAEVYIDDEVRRGGEHCKQNCRNSVAGRRPGPALLVATVWPAACDHNTWPPACALQTGAVFILSMGREPVRVNGKPVESPQELFTGDHIEVGRRSTGGVLSRGAAAHSQRRTSQGRT